MSSCLTYELVPTICPCLLRLRIIGSKNEVALNLSDATIRPINVVDCDQNCTLIGFHIQTPQGGAKVSVDSSFTLEDIETLICECQSGGGTLVNFAEEMLSPALDCDGQPIPNSDALKVITQGVVDVRLCDDQSRYQIACDESNNLIYVDLSITPPQAFQFDGTPYIGVVSNCDVEYKYVDKCFQDENGLEITRIVCWPVDDPAQAQTVWVLSDGTVTETEPANLTACEQVCNPFIQEFSGTTITSNTETFNKIEIINPTCCTLTVTTSAGIFSVLPKTSQTGYIVRCLEFDCQIDSTVSVEDDGNEIDCLDNIIVTLQRTK